jgi:hypothetical protein
MFQATRVHRDSTVSRGESIAANIAPPTLASKRIPTTFCHFAASIFLEFPLRKKHGAQRRVSIKLGGDFPKA